jgi:glycosyltransferase
MKHIYIFNEGSRAANYGIGTYIWQLTDCLKNVPDISLHVVQLYSSEKEFRIVASAGFDTYYFPKVNYRGDRKRTIYYRNICIILSRYIKLATSDSLIFHLNYRYEYPVIDILKKRYPQSKVIYSIHYQDWCFELKGNIMSFRELIRKEQNLTEKQATIINSYNEEKKIFSEVDEIICLCRFTYDLLIKEYAIPENKLSLICNGIKDEGVILSKIKRGELKKSMYFPKNEKIILYVGRLDEIKGLDYLIQSFFFVLKTHPNSRLIVVGDGNYSVPLRECKNIWSKVTFTGVLDKNDVYKLYQIADIGVLPSFHEQCSFVALEMMMHGLPLIVTNAIGNGETVIEGKTGYILPIVLDNGTQYIDTKLLAEKIICLMRTCWRNDSRASYLSEYNILKFRNTILRSYKNNDILKEFPKSHSE